MKRLFFVLFSIFTLNLVAQAQPLEDSVRYLWYQWQYGMRQPRLWADSILRIPFGDTTNYRPQKSGAIMMHTDGTVYKRFGTAWQNIAGNSVTGVTDGNGFDFTLAGGSLSLTTQLSQHSIPFIGASGALSQNNSSFSYNNSTNTMNLRKWLTINNGGTLSVNTYGDSAQIDIVGDATQLTGLGVPKINFYELSTGGKYQMYFNGVDFINYNQFGSNNIVSSPSSAIGLVVYDDGSITNSFHKAMQVESTWDTDGNPEVLNVSAQSLQPVGPWAKYLHIHNESGTQFAFMANNTFKMAPPPSANVETDSLLYWSETDSVVKKSPFTISSGTWTPTFTDVDGFSGFSVARAWTYTRVGNVVNIAGDVSVTITHNAEKYCTFTLPFAIGTGYLQGSIGWVNGVGQVPGNGYLATDSGQGWITFATTASSGTFTVTVSGQYIIIP